MLITSDLARLVEVKNASFLRFFEPENAMTTVAQIPRVASIVRGLQESSSSGSRNRPRALVVVIRAKSVEREAPDLGQPRGRQGDTGRLVGLSAAGMRAEIGAVGFDQEPVQRNAGGHVAQSVQALVRERHHPGER